MADTTIAQEAAHTIMADLMPAQQHVAICTHLEVITNPYPVMLWKIIVATIAVYYVTVDFYRVFLHPLARFPGPTLAAITRCYEGYYDLVEKGQYTLRIAEIHRTCGKLSGF